MRLIKLFLLCFFIAWTLQTRANINNHFTAIKSNPQALYEFFKKMPKGGELHYHLAGGAYPETMLELASSKNYCLNEENHDIYPFMKHCSGIHSKDMLTTPRRYQTTIRAWSMQDFISGSESSHDHFFASFFKFMPVVADFRPQLLAAIMTRAADQHELYLEIMILPDNARSSEFASIAMKKTHYDDKRRALLKNSNFKKNINHTIDESKRILKVARQELGCSQKPKTPVCQLTVKFQYYLLREQPLDALFAQALNGFAAAQESQDIVGINLVQAENGPISLRDYRKQMVLLHYFHTLYPTVHIALHAGELSPDTVSKADQSFHIHDAIFIGNAERIGHGVGIMHEEQTKKILNHMAKHSLPVEINLTSNRLILNISGRNHPIKHYLQNQVPIVLSTDDEGVLRTDLTHQYVNAVLEHNLDYKTIKNINRNALTYSFLAGKSLWANNKTNTPIKNCANLESQKCQEWIKKNPKAQLQWRLEQQLNAFEKKFVKK